MKRTMFCLLLFTIIFFNINVKAKYDEYHAGDIVIVGGTAFVVIEDSDSNTEKLKLLLQGTILGISNPDEIEEACSFSGPSIPGTKSGPTLPENYIQCVTEHADICMLGEIGCTRPLNMPFEERELEDDENLVYDENSSTNIAYFFKNKVDSYFKTVLGLNDVKTRLITADEQMEYAKKNNQFASMLTAFYNLLESACQNEYPVQKKPPKSPPIVGTDDYADTLYGSYMVNSLKYNGSCKLIPNSFAGIDDISVSNYNSPMMVRPVVEINKKELPYELTKEKDGSGNLEVKADEDIQVGDMVSINNIPYFVIENKNNQVRLLPSSSISVSNYDELRDTCNIPSYLDDYKNLSSNELLEMNSCIIEHAEYCNIANVNCYSIELPYNFDDLSNHTYNPELETNIGHYIKNELKDVIENQLGVNVINVDVLSFDEFNNLLDNPILSRYLSVYISMRTLIPIKPSTPPNASSPRGIKAGNNGVQTIPMLVLNYGDDLDNYDEYIDDISAILPVITVSVDDLTVTAKKGDTVKIVTEPDEGYELKELTVTDDDNNSVVYTPSELVKYERGEYTFTMTSAKVHVYAKFVTAEHYDAKSLSQELKITNGLRRLSGEKVSCKIDLNEGDTLTKIVYYDEDNNEIEIPYVLNSNGEYEFYMPEMNVFLRAVIKYADPVYNLYGKDIDIPVQKSIEGETLTFTIKDSRKVLSIKYRDENGNELYPQYTVNNGVYSVVMPNKDVYVDIVFEEETAPVPDKGNTPNDTNVPITGDKIGSSIRLLIICLVTFISCAIIFKNNNKKRKKVLIPYDMV